MILSDILSGGQPKSTGTQRMETQSVPGRGNAGLVGRQIQSLAPGQTIQGEVVSRNGSQVQIKVSDDLILEAKIDRNMNLEMGKTLTFEVRNNGQMLTLSPLFANTASQVNGMKALEMASLPINQSTVYMTGLMMEEGLPVDRNSLQQMFRDVNAFPGASISDVVDLHKLGLPVNEENLAQISSYKNMTHQLVEGMHTVLGALPETMEAMVTEGNVEGAARMFQELLGMIRELGGDGGATESLTEDGQTVQDGEAGAESAASGTVGETPGETAQASGTGRQEAMTNAVKYIVTENGEGVQKLVSGGEDSESAGTVGRESAETQENAQAQESVRNFAVGELLNLVQNAVGEDKAYGGVLQQLAQAMQNGDLAEQAKALQELLEQGLRDGNQPLLRGLLAHKGAQHVLSEGLSRLWTIKPEDVADSGRVEELYSRLNRQLKALTQTLEQSGQTNSTAGKAAGNMSQNLDFLQQLNQAYTYIQLPLRLQQGDAHGDLYVYTNKRSLAAKEGNISALLHLDMEHLGPVDVYVTMQAEHVNTRFFVADDEMLDFLEGHMELLTKRLQKRGYDCSFAMEVKGGQETPESGMKGILAKEHGQPVAQYAFDVRA